jgi:AcrR family transcriptional regulator
MLPDAGLAQRKRAPQARAATTRQALVTAAKRLFASKGYHETEIADLVASTGVTRGALYHHFGGKERLFEAVCTEVAADLHTMTSKAVEGFTGDTWRQLSVSIRTRLELIASSDEIRKILLIDAPSVLGWQKWRSLQEEVSQEPAEKTLEILMAREIIADQPKKPLAQLILAALNEAGLSVAHAADPDQEGMRLFAALMSLLEGLKRR